MPKPEVKADVQMKRGRAVPRRARRAASPRRLASDDDRAERRRGTREIEERSTTPMPKPLRVAGEVDSWCTRCRLILNHRIVSMKSGKAHQVECLTCRSTHLWRPNAPGEKPPGRRRERPRRAAPRAAAAPARCRASPPRCATSRRGRRPSPAAACTTSRPYNVAASFQEGDLVRHKKFGDGVVTQGHRRAQGRGPVPRRGAHARAGPDRVAS